MVINGNKYKVIENVRNGFEEEALREKFTDYFDQYDYVIGDWAYSNLRLKGFCKLNNKHFKKLNDFRLKDKYLQEYCATDCKYFVIEKEKPKS